MKLILSLTLLWTLCSTAAALVCATCTDVQCSSTALITCSTETMCVTASIQADSSGTTSQQIFQACASSSLCPDTGNQTFSVNLGFQSAVASAQCCNTDNCNSATLPFPAAQSSNSLSCFSCDPITSQCTTALQCSGVEDSCFQASLTSQSTTTPAFGCTSANLCAAAESLSSLPLLQSLGNITNGPTCCGSSLCNTVTPSTTTTAPTTTTTAPTTTTTAPTTTTTAPTTTTTAPTTTTTAPTTTTTAPTTTTTAPTTTTTAPTTTTTAPTTTTTAPTTTTTASAACCIRLGMIHLLLGLLVFTLY